MKSRLVSSNEIVSSGIRCEVGDEQVGGDVPQRRVHRVGEDRVGHDRHDRVRRTAAQRLGEVDDRGQPGRHGAHRVESLRSTVGPQVAGADPATRRLLRQL